MRRAGRLVAAGIAAVIPLVLRADAGDELPAATAIDRVTWSTDVGVTRLDIRGAGLVPPRIERPSPTTLRLDFVAASADALGRSLDVDTKEIDRIIVLPASSGLLPPDVSARWLVALARPGLSWRLSPLADRLVLQVGDLGDSADDGGPTSPGVALDTPVLDAHGATRGAQDQPPDPAERLTRPLGVAVPVDVELRAAPSAIANTIGLVRAGEKRLVDARRGEWAHVVGGGWLRLPSMNVAAGPGEAPPAAEPAAARTPMAWAVVTLGTNLSLLVEESLPGDPEAAVIERLYGRPMRLLRLQVTVDESTGYSFRLPSKKGRLVFDMADGRRVESLDPVSVPLRDATSRARLDLAFSAPDLGAGAQWKTWLVFPSDLDLSAVRDAQVDVDGRLHRLFRVPGSGEPVR